MSACAFPPNPNTRDGRRNAIWSGALRQALNMYAPEEGTHNWRGRTSQPASIGARRLTPPKKGRKRGMSGQGPDVVVANFSGYATPNGPHRSNTEYNRENLEVHLVINPIRASAWLS